MITIEKLKEYEKYHGYYDGFYMQKVKKGTNITSDDEWHLIENLIQDIRLIKKELASKEFAKNLETKLQENCDNEETIKWIIDLTEKEW